MSDTEPSPLAYIGVDYTKILHKSMPWRDEHESILLEPYRYLTAHTGKAIRKQVIQALDIWLQVPQDDLAIIGRVVSMLHNASLLIDDVEDDSQLRRGNPVAHKIYGIPQAINTGNYVYFQAFNELRALATGHKGVKGDINGIVIEELLNLHRGQGLDLYWRDTLTCPTEEDYLEMVNHKTGGLFRLLVRLMMACGTQNTETDYVPLVNLIGIFFQIRDDYANLRSDEYAANKAFAEDISEGKFSFPMVHGILSDTSNRQLISILQKRPASPTLKVHAIHHLEHKTKSFDYTLQVLQTLEQEISTELLRLGGNPALEAILAKLSVRDLK